MRTAALKRPLNSAGVRAANERLYQTYPEMAGKQIDPSNPSHAQYIQFWKEAYVESGGELRTTNAVDQRPLGGPHPPACDCHTSLKAVDLIYQPDKDLIYLLTAEDLNELQQEIDLLDSILQPLFAAQSDEALKQAKQEAGQKLAELGVEPVVSGKDLTMWANGTKSSQLTEIKRLMGHKKYTFVRSSLLEMFTTRRRSYPMYVTDRNRSQAYNPKTKQFDYQHFANNVRKQLNDPKLGLKFDLKEVLPRMDTMNAIQEFMDEFTIGTGEHYLAGDESTPYNVTAEAQFFRFSSGASLQTDFQPKNGKITVALQGSLEYKLAEGRSRAQCLLPNPQGWRCQFELADKQFDLGFYRANLEVGLSGFAGASANFGTDIHFEMNKGMPLIKGKSRVTPGGRLKPAQGHRGAQQANASAELFVGVKAGCDVKVSLNWQSPEENQKFVTLASAGAGVAVAAGAGVEGKLQMEFSPRTRKFVFRADAGVVFGVGCSGQVDSVIEGNNLIRLAQWVYHQLMKQDFGYLDFIPDDDFKHLQRLIGASIFLQREISSLADATVMQISVLWEKLNADRREAEDLAKQILANDSLYRFAAPEIKGRVLATLCRRFLFSMETEQEMAIIKLLRYTQSRNEYRLILKNMSETGGHVDPTKAEGMLEEILDGPRNLQYRTWRKQIAATPHVNEPVIARGPTWQPLPIEQRREQLLALNERVRNRGYLA